MTKFYLNVKTGETTENHRAAVEWFRAGANVEIWRNGQLVITWTH